jgi:hypothetical protein
MNKIDSVREETLDKLKDAPAGIEEKKSDLSPSGNYRLEETHYEWNPIPNKGLSISKAEIYDTNTEQVLFSFLVNECPVFHSWITKGDTEYFLCAEDLCGGQTVIDLTNKKMVSYTENDNGFIWTNHILSPDETMLAVFGCYWGTAYFCMIYDFANPLELPLRMIKETEAIGYDFLGWIDNKHLKIIHNKDGQPVIIEIQQ